MIGKESRCTLITSDQIIANLKQQTFSCLFYPAAMVMDPAQGRLDDIIINAHRNNVGGSDAQDVRSEIFHDLLSPHSSGLNRTPHLEQARSPGR